MADFDPKISSGAVVAGSQLARDNGSTTQNPTSNIIYDGRTLANVPGAETQQAFVTGRVNQLLQSGFVSVDNGTANTLPLSQSQAIPPYDINAFANSPEIDPGGSLAAQAAAYQAGIGARNDDAKTVTGNSTKDIIKQTFQSGTNQRIVTQNNVLDDYASYTYQLSWYMLTPAQYNSLKKSIRPNIAGWSLLMQSGGAPLTSPVNQPGRSPLFPEDFYLDDLEILSRTPNKGTGMPHNAVELKFKVIEPNGLTLIDRLYDAAYAAWGSTSASIDQFDPNGWGSEGQPTAYTPNAGQQQTQLQINRKNRTGIPNHSRVAYCLGIKFYGYDNAGNLIAPATGKYTPDLAPGQAGPANTSYEIIHKLIAFNITELKFRMAAGASSKGIEYMIAGKRIDMNIAFGQSRGTVPFQFELTGATVKDILVGNNAAASLPKRQEGRVPNASPPKNPAFNAAGYNGPDGESVGS